MTALADLSYELDGFAFGRGTNINVTKVDYGSPTVTNADTHRLRADGVRFGRDYQGGAVLTFELNVLSVAGTGALDLVSQMRQAWLADSVRTTPGAVSTLRMKRAGRTRVVYGRARRWATVSHWSASGWIPVTCDFQAIDHLFYTDAPLAQTLSILPPSSGGFTYPIVYPMIAGGTGVHPGAVTIDGDRPGWPVFTIYAVGGPLVNPAVSVVGGWAIGLNMTLQPGQSVTIDTRPWSRDVTTGTGANVAGYLTPTSPRLAAASLGPGSVEILLTGQDSTNTAYLSTQIHQVYASY